MGLEIDISFIILTHNRPKLFERCFNSVRKLGIENSEIIVNNDTRDITEIRTPNTYYYYDNEYYLDKIYRDCFHRARGKYVYFLEDDDIILSGFKNAFNKILKDGIDVAICNYWHESQCNKYKFNNNIFNKNDFFKKFDDFYFQLGQIIFKKSSAVGAISEFKDNKLNSDFLFFKEIQSENIVTLSDIIYKQTTDGKDNISFKIYNKDERFK